MEENGAWIGGGTGGGCMEAEDGGEFDIVAGGVNSGRTPRSHHVHRCVRGVVMSEAVRNITLRFCEWARHFF